MRFAHYSIKAEMVTHTTCTKMCFVVIESMFDFLFRMAGDKCADYKRRPPSFGNMLFALVESELAIGIYVSHTINVWYANHKVAIMKSRAAAWMSGGGGHRIRPTTRA